MKQFKSLAEKAALENRIYQEADQVVSEIQKFAASIDAMNLALEDDRLLDAKATVEVLKELKAYYDYAKIPTVIKMNGRLDRQGSTKVFFDI